MLTTTEVPPNECDGPEDTSDATRFCPASARPSARGYHERARANGRRGTAAQDDRLPAADVRTPPCAKRGTPRYSHESPRAERGKNSFQTETTGRKGGE
jgi:hypothetical protein